MSDPLDDLRAQFPALERGLIFADWAATGLIPTCGIAAVTRYLERTASAEGSSSTWMHVEMAEVRQSVRRRVARALGTSASAVALVESTTAGLAAAAASLRLEPGDNVVLSAVDYPAVARPFLRRAREGVAVRFVQPSGGNVSATDLLQRIDSRTRAIAVSTAVWTTGALLDVDSLVRGLEAHPHVTLVLDAVQTFGIIPLRLPRRAFVACGGHKWLCSPLGAGFLAVDEDAAARHPPIDPGFLAGRAPRASFGQWFEDPTARVDEPIEFPPIGRSHEMGGTPSYPGALGLDAMLGLLAAVPDGVVASHARGLAARCAAGLDSLGFPVRTPPGERERGAVISFGLPGGPEEEAALVAAQAQRSPRILISRRYGGGLGGIRVGFHGMNRTEDVDRLLEALGEWRRSP